MIPSSPLFSGKFTNLTVESEGETPLVGESSRNRYGSPSEAKEAGNITADDLKSLIIQVVDRESDIFRTKTTIPAGQTVVSWGSSPGLMGTPKPRGTTVFSPVTVEITGDDADKVAAKDAEFKRALEEKGVRFDYEA